jgi:hypothetical protein
MDVTSIDGFGVQNVHEHMLGGSRNRDLSA